MQGGFFHRPEGPVSHTSCLRQIAGAPFLCHFSQASSPGSKARRPSGSRQAQASGAGKERLPGSRGQRDTMSHRPNEVLQRRPGPRPAPQSGPISHGVVGGAGRRQGGRCALPLAAPRRAPSVVGCGGCRSRREGGGGGRRRAGGHSARGRSMAAAVVRRGPAGWWRWHRRVMGKDLPLPSAPVAPLCRPGGERPGLSRGAQLPRCPWRPRALRARYSSGAASVCGIPGDGTPGRHGWHGALPLPPYSGLHRSFGAAWLNKCFHSFA